ncbi:unnamed protein product, partial [marine sediment metagenome]
MARNLGEAIILVTSKTGGAIRGLSKLNQAVDRLGQNVATVGKNVSIVGGLITATFGGITAKGTKVFKEINQSLREAQSIAGATDETWKRVEATVERLGIKTQFMQTQLAAGVRQIVSAGFFAAEVMEPLIANASDMAAAMGADLPQSVGLVISAMEAFEKGMVGTKTSMVNITRVTNDLTDIQGAARVEAHDLEFFMRQLGGTMIQFSLDSRDALAAFGAINQVMGNGRRASTALRQGIDMLGKIATRSEFATVIVPALRKVGLTADDINPRIVGV